MNYLIEGTSGSGKTWLARKAAYLWCKKGMSFREACNDKTNYSSQEITACINEETCQCIQVYPSLSFEDLFFGVVISPEKGCIPEEGLKPFGEFLRRASEDERRYVAIIEDINRASVDTLLGPFMSAISNGYASWEMPNGETLSFSSNLSIIFTTNTCLSENTIPLSFARRMDEIEQLTASDDILLRYYRECGAEYEDVGDFALSLFARTNSFIGRHFQGKGTGELGCSQFFVGHGYFIVPVEGAPQQVLELLREAFLLRVIPYVQGLWRDGFLDSNPDEELKSLIIDIGTKLAMQRSISSVQKVFVADWSPVGSFSSQDSFDYIKTKIIEVPDYYEFRTILEAIIDAILANNVIPYDLACKGLLFNQNVGWVANQRRPDQRASFLIDGKDADGFVYLTRPSKQTNEAAQKIKKRRPPHAYYSKENPQKGGRWEKAVGYRFSYVDGRADSLFIPITGVRNHLFTITTSKLYTESNPVEIYEACYQLVAAYIELYIKCLNADMVDDVSSYALLRYLMMEQEYLRELHNEVKSLSVEDNPKFNYFCEGLLLIKSLWTKAGDSFDVDVSMLESMENGEIEVSTVNFRLLHRDTAGQGITVESRKVAYMKDGIDYQKIMEKLDVRQLVFQGPPGTSKTFESKRFVLSQLNGSAPCLSEPFSSGKAIEDELEPFRLTEADYDNPEDSTRLKSGGWDIVQFHPSYSYEDFIRGIRVSTENGVPVYKTINRIFGKISKFALLAKRAAGANPPARFYLVIDEINRADLATVFGELIYGLEYRGSKMTTPYSVNDNVQGLDPSEIEVSDNLYLVGSMNTADKSIGTLDYAIRRRFLFIDSPASRDVVLESITFFGGTDEERSLELFLFDAVQSLFDSDTFFNEDYHRGDMRIGHTYFLRTKTEESKLIAINRLTYQVVPIIREYVRDGILEPVNESRIQENLVDEICEAFDSDEVEASKLMGENLLLYASLLGEKTKSNHVIDVDYIKGFVDDLSAKLGFE